jgi:hypothetical protein
MLAMAGSARRVTSTIRRPDHRPAGTILTRAVATRFPTGSAAHAPRTAGSATGGDRMAAWADGRAKPGRSHGFSPSPSRPIHPVMRDRRPGCARPGPAVARRATAYRSASAGVCLVLLGIMLTQMILLLPLPPWWQGVIVGLVVTSVVGWLARATTAPTESSAPFEAIRTSSCRHRDMRLCRRHRVGPAESQPYGGPSSNDLVSPWFQLW